jgi:hypothetical protein
MRFQPLNNWTDEQNAELRQLCREHSLPTIVERLGRPYHQVKYQIRKLGLHTQAVGERPFKVVAEIKRYSDRHGNKAAAAHFNLSHHVIQNIRRRYLREVKQTGEDLSPESILALRRRASWLAIRKGRPSEKDDFASYCVLHRLTHPGSFVRVEHHWQNFSKQQYGDPSSRPGRNEWRANSRYLEITDAPDFDSPHPGIQVAGEDAREGEGEISFGGLAKRHGLTGIERTLFLLYYKWGLVHAEIAEVLDLSEARISQLHIAMTLSIKKDLPPPVIRKPPVGRKRYVPLPPLPNGEKRPVGRPRKAKVPVEPPS